MGTYEHTNTQNFPTVDSFFKFYTLCLSVYLSGMDLLPAENSQIPKKHRFRSLKLVNVDMDQVLAQQPVGVHYGRLDNGLFYYVRSNSKPRMRAALALAVKAG